MKRIKLKWKKKYLSDNSGHWYSAKVNALDWEYTVSDTYYDSSLYQASLFISLYSDEINIQPRKKFKTRKKAMQKCEEHLAETYKKLKKFITSKTCK
jgi:hypothetical protein